MQDALAPNTWLGYCTNVHAGPTFEQMKANLQTHALVVKEQVSPDAPMGIGLWLAEPAARQMIATAAVPAFADWLSERGLVPFTFNGFPFGDFHEPIVKHKVYQPTWADRSRLEYTLMLARIQASLLGDLDEGGISTLPIGWASDIASRNGAVEQAANHLLELVAGLHAIEQDTGKCIHVDIEPEPGCYLDTSADVVALFKEHLFAHGDEAKVRRHLRVCHDICHAAVMFESQADMIQRYADAGVLIGKVQVSSAVRAPFGKVEPVERVAMLNQLRQFREPRYLHQTMTRDASGSTTFFDDLPGALQTVSDDAPPTIEWRTHFHVPLFLDRFGLLESTQEQVIQCLDLLRDSGVRHFEAETYAWDVLPDDLKVARLADGIAHELQWLIGLTSASHAEPSP